MDHSQGLHARLDQIWNNAKACKCNDDKRWAQEVNGDIMCERCSEWVVGGPEENVETPANDVLEMQLLLLWKENGIDRVYKYKNRIKDFPEHEGLVSVELFYDLTHSLFKDVPDIASYVDMQPRRGYRSVDDLIRTRDRW